MTRSNGMHFTTTDSQHLAAPHQVLSWSSRIDFPTMGGTFSDLEFIPYDHWMPEEDPTFYVPASLTLTENQRSQLQDSGFQQGEPFVLTKDGALTKPASKKFALRGMKSSFSIRKGSLQLFEESPGNFSLEFYYYTDEAVILEIHLNAVDASSSKYIK